MRQTRRPHRFHVLPLLASACALGPFFAACAPGGSGGGTAPEARRQDSGSPTSDGGFGSDANVDTFESCAGSTSRAETRVQPVDVIWVVDSSGSMRGEADIVQSNMNNFAAAVAESGVDYHVVVIGAPGFVSVPPPLGTDAERFLRVDANVQSHDGLTAPLNNFATYSEFLREDASTHFVIVTDDESSLGAGGFITSMEENLGHPFKLHAIASPPGSSHVETRLIFTDREDGCEGPNGEAADNGDQYWSAATATGGEMLSICTADWTGLFATLTEAIAQAAPLPCRYALPDPPSGETLNRSRINVVYTSSYGEPPARLGFVESEADCDASHWFYEGDEIVLCPTTCDIISRDEAGQIATEVGCQTMIL